MRRETDLCRMFPYEEVCIHTGLSLVRLYIFHRFDRDLGGMDQYLKEIVQTFFQSVSSGPTV